MHLVISLIVVYCVVFKMVKDYEPFYKKVKRLDADPTFSTKSNLWYKEHGKDTNPKS